MKNTLLALTNTADIKGVQSLCYLHIYKSYTMGLPGSYHSNGFMPTPAPVQRKYSISMKITLAFLCAKVSNMKAIPHKKSRFKMSLRTYRVAV